MAEKTGIAWTNSTFNPWIGCTKVSPGCDNCYAEALDKRHRWKGATHWGVGVPRMRTGKSNWHQPVKWNRQADESGERHLVFCASLADVFDNEVPLEWRADLFDLIYATPHLTWLILTKRIGNVAKLMPWDHCLAGGPPKNVWLGASIVNQEEADRDIPKLLATPATKRFVSYEPAQGPVDWANACAKHRTSDRDGVELCGMLRHLDWIIVGGESSQGAAKARPFHIEWARKTVRQCRAAGVAPFVKQLGSNIALVADQGWRP
jgi:protein gp37